VFAVVDGNIVLHSFMKSGDDDEDNVIITISSDSDRGTI